MPDSAGDVFGIWRSFLQQWETQANSALSEAASSEAFSREVNRAISASLKLQGAFNEAVEKGLATLNMPSRNDVARLAEQLSGIERKLDLLLARQAGEDMPIAAPQAPRVARTRRPPAERPPAKRPPAEKTQP